MTIGTNLANLEFDEDYLSLTKSEILNNYLYVPFNFYSTPHEELQAVYRYISSINSQDQWLMDELLEYNFGFLIGFNKNGVLDFDEIYCYAFKFIPTSNSLEVLDKTISSRFTNKYKISVELTPYEQILFSGCFINNNIAVRGH